MSRIGKQPIKISDKVKVDIAGSNVTVTGPKGTLSKMMHPAMKLNLDGNTLKIERPSDSNFHKSLHGLSRQLIYNMVYGVETGFSKTLEIIGVGYRAELIGKHLKLLLGYSHPCIIKLPEGIEITLDSPTRIKVTGIDKELVGMVAAKIREMRRPEPYKGKGIRYENEYVRRKAGKTAV